MPRFKLTLEVLEVYNLFHPFDSYNPQGPYLLETLKKEKLYFTL